MWSARICALALLASPLIAQHEFNPAEAEMGGRIYSANCVYCHGPDGDQVPGVDLGRNKFKRARTDADLMDVIRNGVPTGGMPAQKIPDRQIGMVVAYIRSLAAAPPSTLPPGGDAGRGKSIFDGKGGCLTCHRVKDEGSRLGPDLSDIGGHRRVIEMEQAMLDPEAHVSPENRFVRVVTKDGTSINGRLLNQDTFTVQVIDARQRLLSFQKSDLREFAAAKSPMPSYRDKLSSNELSDLIAYLVSLKGHS
jgi:putative heme-binding domain-containing protein